MRKAKTVSILLCLILLAGCSLKAKWEKATPQERARIVIGDIQNVMVITLKSGGAFVDANPQHRTVWKEKVLPAIQVVNNVCKDYLAKMDAGASFSYTDVIQAVGAHMSEIRAIMVSWGVKVGWRWEGGIVWDHC